MFKNLLVPVHGSDLAERAMTVSIGLARQLGAAITAFVVEPDVPLPTEGTQPARYAQSSDDHVRRTDSHAHDVLTRFGALALESGVVFNGRHMRTDDIDTAIINVAEEQGCDMIVMVSHGRGVFGELLFGSHTKAVLSRTKLPLLVLR